jgi:hypothetical protein
MLGSDRVSVTVLASDDALEPTKKNLCKRSPSIAEQSRAQDMLVIYMAAHGAAAARGARPVLLPHQGSTELGYRP